MRLNLKKNVTPILNIVISFTFWIYVDSVSLPDLDPISKTTLILIPIELEHEWLILDSRIPLLGNECEFEFYDLDQTHEPTPTLEPKLDLSFIP